MLRNRHLWMNAFLGVVAVVCGLAIWSVIDLPWRARVFPQTVAAIGLVVTVLAWLAARRGVPGEAPPESADATGGKGIPTWPHLVWAAGYLVGIAVAGIPAASGVWLAFFLRREDGMRWHIAVAAGAAAAVVLVVLGRVARMPGGWLFG